MLSSSWTQSLLGAMKPHNFKARLTAGESLIMKFFSCFSHTFHPILIDLINQSASRFPLLQKESIEELVWLILSQIQAASQSSVSHRSRVPFLNAGLLEKAH